MVGRQGLHREVLVSAFERAGAFDVRSHLATGNVSFECESWEAAATIRAAAEAEIAAVIGRDEPVILRSQLQLVALLESDPFAEYNPDAFTAEITFLDDRAGDMDATLFDQVAGLGVVQMSRQELLTVQRRGERALHPLPVVEKLTGERATTRALSTVLRLAGLSHR